jgi:hypothetical protein
VGIDSANRSDRRRVTRVLRALFGLCPSTVAPGGTIAFLEAARVLRGAGFPKGFADCVLGVLFADSLIWAGFPDCAGPALALRIAVVGADFSVRIAVTGVELIERACIGAAVGR